MPSSTLFSSQLKILYKTMLVTKHNISGCSFTGINKRRLRFDLRCLPDYIKTIQFPTRRTICQYNQMIEYLIRWSSISTSRIYNLNYFFSRKTFQLTFTIIYFDILIHLQHITIRFLFRIINTTGI